MAEILISLVRNAACVAKSLLPPEHAVMQPLMSFPYVPFLPLGEGETAGTSGGAGGKVQLEMFTGLEGFIGLLQLVGACFNLWKGIKGLGGGVIMAEYIVRWRNALADDHVGIDGNNREVALLSRVLVRQDASNNRGIIAGICQLVIGTGLVCLACFSWKLVGIRTTATAVAILEVALLVLLAIGVAGLRKVWRVSTKIQGLDKPQPSDLEVVEFLAPHLSLDRSWIPDARVTPSPATLRGYMEGMSRIQRVVLASTPGDYDHLVREKKDRAKLDAFLILLNVVAFFGYGTIPLDVFFPDRSILTNWLPPGTTAWWGNLAGDVAWTIEPVTVIAGPYLWLKSVPPNVVKHKTQ